MSDKTGADSNKTGSSDEEAAIAGSLARSLATAQAGVSALEKAAGTDPALVSSFTNAVRIMRNIRGRIIVIGVGKSGHIGRKLAATLASTGSPAYFVHATEASHGDLGMVSAEDVILAISWSGETAELANTLNYAKRFSVPLIAITAGAGSTLARHADAAIVLPAVAESCPHGLAPTTSTLLQLAIGDALAIAILELNGFSVGEFKDLHPGGKLGAFLQRAIDLAHSGGEIPLIDEGAMMSDAIVEITSKGFGAVGVICKKGTLTGIITDGDLRRHMNVDLLKQTAKSIMSACPKTIGSGELAGEALRKMQKAKISVLFVTEGEKPVAILHMQDLLRAGVA